MFFLVRTTKNDEQRVNTEEAFEIDVGPIHDVEGAGLGEELVEDVDVVRFAIANADKRGDVAPQVQQRVHLHGGLAPAEPGPREQREAQVDGGRVQSVETLIEIHADRIAGVQGPRDANQDLGEIGIDPPVAVTRWRRPVWSASPGSGIPCGRAWRRANAGTLRCRAGFRGRSAGQTPCIGTDPSRRSRTIGDPRRSGLRSGGIRDPEEN